MEILGHTAPAVQVGELAHGCGAAARAGTGLGPLGSGPFSGTVTGWVSLVPPSRVPQGLGPYPRTHTRLADAVELVASLALTAETSGGVHTVVPWPTGLGGRRALIHIWQKRKTCGKAFRVCLFPPDQKGKAGRSALKCTLTKHHCLFFNPILRHLQHVSGPRWGGS